MSLFMFRLAPLLRRRRRTEDVCARELRRAIEQHQSAQADEAALARALAVAQASLAAETAAGLSGAALRTLAGAVDDLTTRVRTAAALTATEAAHVERRRTELVDAARARRTMERLEEMQREAWRAGIARAEQRIDDDLATTRQGATG
jgi:flagellar export protein FliJ